MNNFICKISGGMVTLIVLDIILVLFIAAALCYILLKNKQTKQQDSTSSNEPAGAAQNELPEQETQAESLGDKATNLPNFLSPNAETSESVAEAEYVIADTEAPRAEAPKKVYDNKVEHFTNQISDISEEATTELKSKVTFKPRTNPEPPKRVVKDETINLSEKKDTPIKVSSFEDSASFLDTLKEQQSTEKTKKQTKASTTKKATAANKTTKKTATKTASDETKPKRKYTKRK